MNSLTTHSTLKGSPDYVPEIGEIIIEPMGTCYECDQVKFKKDLKEYTLSNGFKRMRCKDENCTEE